MRRLTPADYRRMPWRNGGGTTTEITIAPEGAGLAGARFLYRVSIADVGADGPFSRFEGYDRHILLLAGAGMMLDCGEHGRIELRAPFVPHVFSGDWDVSGTLTGGPVQDFNVIVDRARAAATLEVRDLARPAQIPCEAGTAFIVHVIAGQLDQASEGDTLVADVPFDLAPHGLARVVIASIVPRSP